MIGSLTLDKWAVTLGTAKIYFGG